MPIHDWTRVDAGIFHHFHFEWISALARAFNCGLLPAGHYALVEQIAGPWEPDVLTLKGPSGGVPSEPSPPSGVALAEFPPQVGYRAKTQVEQYAAKARSIVVRHTSDHQVIAVLEIVSPGNKSSRRRFEAFVSKAEKLLLAGVHLLVIDLFPPGPRDPQGIHKAIWEQFTDTDFELPAERPLTLAAYIGGPFPEAFVEPTMVGASLRDMPLFLSPEIYVSVPLEATYATAFEIVPQFYREVLSSPESSL